MWRVKVLLDTNVLLRSVEPTDNDHKIAADAVAVLRASGHELCLVPQNFYEFWVVSTRPVANNGRGKTPAEVNREFTVFKSLFTFLPDTPAVFPEWETLVTTHAVIGKSAHDARLVAAMSAHGVTHLLTFNDADFRRYPGINLHVPSSVVSSGSVP
jgi:predicted nucleic acid-binding protein